MTTYDTDNGTDTCLKCGVICGTATCADCLVQTLRCDMQRDCDSPVTRIDPKGYAYCTHHGEMRAPSRKLTPAEVRTLERGETIARY